MSRLGGRHIIHPAIMLAFANSRNDLPELDKERIQLDTILTSHFTVIQKDRATHQRVEDAFRSHGQDLRIFHFGGHADETTLAFLVEKGKDGTAYVKGLAQEVGSHRGIELVFLNACLTKNQVGFFHAAGVPAVIGTNAPIRDDIAREFAELFYQNFIGGNQRTSLQEAFQQAKHQLEKRHDDDYQRFYTRSLVLEEEHYAVQFPYELNCKTTQAEKLCYQDLLREGESMDSIPHRFAHLKLDRDVADGSFQSHAEHHIQQDIKRPICALVQGKEVELPEALCRRFRKFTIATTFEELDQTLSEARFLQKDFVMPLATDYLQEGKALNLVKNHLRKELQLSISARKIHQLKLESLLEELDPSWEVVLIQHNWYAAEWDAEQSPKLLEAYLGDFWKMAEQHRAFWEEDARQSLPVIVLLFSVEHPPKKGWFSRSSALFDKIAGKFAPFGLSLQPLESVPRKDMRRWNNEFAGDQQDLTDRIYPKDKPLPMKQVLPELEKVIRKYWQG